MYLSRKLISGVIAIIAIAAASTAFAAIPDAGGVIQGCYDKSSGQLRVADTATNQPKGCSIKEAALTWSQQGPQGAPGIQGPKGEPGPSDIWVYSRHDLESVGLNTVVGSMTNLGISGLLTAKLLIGTTDNSGVVTCTLYSGLDPIDDASATVYSPNGAAWTTLFMEGIATHANGRVVCSGNNGFARDVVITSTVPGALHPVSP